MSSMDDYVRKQVMRANLETSLQDLYKDRTALLTRLVMIDKVIEKHVAFIEMLEEEED